MKAFLRVDGRISGSRWKDFSRESGPQGYFHILLLWILGLEEDINSYLSMRMLCVIPEDKWFITCIANLDAFV